MPKTVNKPKKSKNKNRDDEEYENEPSPYPVLIFTALAGAVFGLSAPGFDQWYLAWIGLVPLFLLVCSSPSVKDALLRGFIFGTAYNLIYLNWYLGLHPLNWMGLADWQSLPLAIFCWFFVSCQQGLIIALFAGIMHLLPLSGTFLPSKVEDRLCLPAYLVLPFVWTLMAEKIGNAHDLLGVPWSMIEYSQYQQKALIQVTSVVGGIGLSLLIVAVNVSLATLIASFSRKLSFKPLAAGSIQLAFNQVTIMALLVASCLIFGFSRLADTKYEPNTTLSIVQGNINIEMQKTKHRYSLRELLDHYDKLIKDCPAGLCVWTESSLPTYLKESPLLLADLQENARAKKLDMIVGAIDKEGDDQSYNSAFGINKEGLLLNEAYHKRFLVPVGEYTPHFVHYLPDFIQRLTDTPAGTGFSAGKKPVILDLSGQAIAPLICFETISPELVASSVRNGGQLLVNISDLAWFHNSMIGEQTTAFAVFRAIENGRYFVYAANTGPSMIISPLGMIEKKTELGQEALLTSKVSLVSQLTPFTQWFN